MRSTQDPPMRERVDGEQQSMLFPVAGRQSYSEVGAIRILLRAALIPQET